MITILEQPVSLQSVFSDCRFVVNSTATATDLKLKARLEVSKDNSAFMSLGLMYGEVEGDNFVFNFSNRLQTYLTYDVFDVTENQLIADTPNSISYYKVTFIEQYANGIGLQEEFATVATTAKQVVNVRIKRRDKLTLTDLVLADETSKMLTDAPIRRNVVLTDDVQLSFIDSGAKIIAPIVLRNGNELDAVYIGAIEVDHGRGTLLIKVADVVDENTRFFTVHLEDNETGDQVSEALLFTIDKNCYEDHFQICWLNIRGGFDSYTFVGGKIETVNVEKETALQYLPGTAGFSDSDTQVVSSQTQTTIKTFSLWEDYETRVWLSGILYSPVVFLIDDGKRIAIDIKTKEHTTSNLKTLLQVPIEFSYINEIVR